MNQQYFASPFFKPLFTLQQQKSSIIYHLLFKEIEYRNQTEIEMRRKNQIPAWKEVVYHEDSEVPTERWGHQLVRVSEDRIILFGGFGGSTSEGKYLDDLWQFNTTSFTWKQLHPFGQVPQKRSNYTIHHNPIDQQLILFGGGSSNKIRYNDICVLDLATLTWSKCIPDPSEQAPWERTYHTGVFLFPFLVIFGGEGGPNMDLDDSWAFNIQTKKWKRLCFQENQQNPDRRRFHSSALIGTSMYVLSGCKNGNYELFGDIHRVDLKGLLEEDHERPLVWERVVKNNQNLKRWGQSCDVFDGRIYIFAGRVNQNSDTNNLIAYNPEDHSVQEVKLQNKGLPNPRRRHSSIMIDSSLLIFGGYNGKYFKDFHFLSLKGIQNTNQSIQAKVYQSQQFIAQLSLHQSKLQSDCVLELHFQEKVMSINSNHSILNKNEHLKNIYKYNEDKRIIKITLPLFCSITSFRIIHHFLSTNSAFFSLDFTHQSYIQLLKLAQYFNCSQIYPFIDSQLSKFLTVQNVKDLLKECIAFPLHSFIHSAIDFIIQHKISTDNNKSQLQEDNIETTKNLRARSEVSLQSKQDFLIYTLLRQAQQLSQFHISQTILRNKKATIFSRIKNVFSSKQDLNRPPKEVNEASKDKANHPGCFQRFINFFTTLSFRAQ